MKFLVCSFPTYFTLALNILNVISVDQDSAGSRMRETKTCERDNSMSSTSRVFSLSNIAAFSAAYHGIVTVNKSPFGYSRSMFFVPPCRADTAFVTDGLLWSEISLWP